jgi:GTP cyclohydrolase I
MSTDDPIPHLARALAALGFDADPEMARTAQQVAELLTEFQVGPVPKAELLPTTSSDLIVVRDLPYHSLCAHHLLPFFGHATLVVRPQGQVAGFGHYPRVLKALARQPQLEERLAAQLADALMEGLQAKAVGVKLTARQLCVEMRGAQSHGSFEVFATRGQTDPELQLALHGGGPTEGSDQPSS